MRLRKTYFAELQEHSCRMNLICIRKNNLTQEQPLILLSGSIFLADAATKN